MNTKNLSLFLSKNIPAPEWLWLLLALRQDALVWSELERAAEIHGLIEKMPESLNEWSLVELALSEKVESAAIRQFMAEAVGPVDQEIISDIKTTRQAWDQDPELLTSFEQAALLALSFKQEYQEKGNWNGLAAELDKKPLFGQAVLACLLGVVAKPQEPLLALFEEVSLKHIPLAVNALLAQPHNDRTQKEALQGLIEALPVGLAVQILSYLQKQRPWFVPELAEKMLARAHEEETTLAYSHLVDQFNELSDLLDQADLYQQASQPNRSIALLIEAIKNARQMQGYLSSRLAQAVTLAKQTGKAEKQETDLEAWKQAVRLAPEEPEYAAGLAQLLVNEGRLADAQLHLGAWQSKDRYTQHAHLLIASSQVALGLGDKEKSVELAKQAWALVEGGSNLDLPGYLALRDIFQQSGDEELALQVVTSGLQHFPTNSELLVTSASIYLNQKKPGKSLDQIIAYLATAQASASNADMPPTPLFVRQLYIQSLEAAQEWAAALEERLELLEASKKPSRDEIFDTARCALQAGQHQKALELCRPILDEDPEDDMALGLAGEAFGQSGETITAIEYLRKAVRVAPTRSELWLKLADACHQAGMEAQRMDVLKAATQALPEEAEIQLVLGELYQSRNSPAQALIYLRRAASLDATPKISLRLGQVLLQLGHTEEARELLEKAYQSVRDKRLAMEETAEVDQLEVELMHAYGRSLLSVGDGQQAIDLLSKVVELQPEVPSPYMDLGRALLSGQTSPQQAQQAIAYLQKAVSLVAEHGAEVQGHLGSYDPVTLEAEALSLLAEAYAASGELQQSQAVYRQVLDDQVAQRSGWRARLALGFSRVALKLDQPETALAVLKEALQKESKNVALLQALAEAYMANNLTQDAYDTASKLIEQQPIELETVSWFVNLGNRLRKQPGAIQSLIQGDMLRVLQNAVRTAPTRADLLVQLGKILLEKGDRQPAMDIFRRLTSIDVQEWQTETVDLFQAGKMIREWGEPVLSAFLLEKAIEIADPDHEPLSRKRAVPIADLYQELSLSHLRADNQEEALEAVEKAIQLKPDQAKYYLQKADIYAELNQPQKMLDSLKPAIKLSPDDPATNQRVAQALYINGDLPGALKHADQALSQQENGLDEVTDHQTRYLAAEISQAMLKPRQALAYLPGKLIAMGEPEHKLEQISLQAELALELGDRNLAEAAVVEMRKLDAEDPRSLSVQARLASLKGDDEAARRLLQTANQMLENQLSRRGGRNGKPTGNLKPDRERALCRSALWLRQWEMAYLWACRGVECAPHEPFSHLLKVQVIVERAEEQALCNDLEVMVHAPGEEALSSQARQEFEEAIKSAEQTSAPLSTRSGEEPNQAIEVWRLRGVSVFNPDYPSAVKLEEAVLSFPPTEAEVGAMLMAYRKNGQPAKAVKASKAEFIETYGGREITEHPLVLTQLSLAYAQVDLVKAQDIAAKASQKAEMFKLDQGTRRWPEVPMTYYLQAKLALQAGLLAAALQAIQKALTDWPEEPRWHALAAEIYQGSDLQKGLPNLQTAKTHLELAARLEPRHAPHAAQLGKLYMTTGDYAQAVTTLEQASKLAQVDTEIWMNLAEVYQISGNLEKAAESAERAMGLLTDKTPALILRGKIALKANDPRLALSQAQSVLNVDPENGEALHLSAYALEALQRTDEAIHLLDKAIPRLKDPVSTQVEKMMLIYRLKGLEAGLEALQDLVDQNVHSPELLALLAQWLSEADQEEAAVQIARAALQADQGRLTPAQQAALYKLIGTKMRQAGQLDQAIHALSQAAQLEPDWIDHYLNLATAYQDRREHAQALKVLEQTRMLFPEDYRPYYLSGVVYKENKQYVEAEKMLRLATKMAPGEVSIHRLLGAVVALNLVHNR